MAIKCPIINSYQCPNECLFNRKDGCAVILTMDTTFENEKKLIKIAREIEALNTRIESILNLINK